MSEDATIDIREQLATRYLREAHFWSCNQTTDRADVWVRAAAMALDIDPPSGFVGRLVDKLPDGRPLLSVDETTYAELAIIALRRLP